MKVNSFWYSTWDLYQPNVNERKSVAFVSPHLWWLCCLYSWKHMRRFHPCAPGAPGGTGQSEHPRFSLFCQSFLLEDGSLGGWKKSTKKERKKPWQVCVNIPNTFNQQKGDITQHLSPSQPGIYSYTEQFLYDGKNITGTNTCKLKSRQKC